MKRVAAYCRVSTEADDQLNSLENQKQYFERYISQNLDWEFCGLYVDEGISGTSVEKRAGFQKMVADAENKKFDLLLTKEISRFARNTLDSIYYTRKLKRVCSRFSLSEVAATYSLHTFLIIREGVASH